jgi:uncharacterized membrane protein YkvA (DUF1232 family)
MGLKRSAFKFRRIIKFRRQIKMYIAIFHDSRTPLPAKILLGIAVGYILLPIDFIPDFIPFVGLLDDAIITPFLFYLALKMIPHDLLEEYRFKYAKKLN